MRQDASIIRQIVKDFAGSWQSRIWHFVTDDVRGALVDSIVMQHVRMAHAADNESPITPGELIAFRESLIAALAAGIPRRGDSPLRFAIGDSP